MSLLRNADASCGWAFGVAAAAPVFFSGNVQVVKPSSVPGAGEPSCTPRVCGPEPASERMPIV